MVERWERNIAAGNEAYHQGDYTEAEKQYSAAIIIADGFGLEGPHLATSLNNLANLYRAQGRYAEAEPLFRRSLAIWEKTLGPDHPEVATGLNNLALLYWVQGRYAEAAARSRRAEQQRCATP